MLYTQGVGLTKDTAYPLTPSLFSSNKVTSRKSKKLWTKGPEWNNAAYEEKEKYHYFTHPAEDHTNFHPISTKEKEWESEKKQKTHTGSKKK